MNQNELTPHERFNAIIKDSLAPLMKKYHFKKKGHKFIRIDNELSYIITTYKSRSNTKDRLDFRIEWGIDLREDKKKPLLPYKSEIIYGTLYDITKSSKDQWYQLSNLFCLSINDEAIKHDISQSLEDMVIPFLISFKTIGDILKVLEVTPLKERKWSAPNGEGQTAYCVATLYLYLGNSEKSLYILNKEIDQTKIEGFKKSLINFRDVIRDNEVYKNSSL